MAARIEEQELLIDALFDRIGKIEERSFTGRPETVGDIVQITAEAFGYDSYDITGTFRDNDVMRARQAFYLLARTDCCLNMAAIGALTNRDSSTISYGYRKARYRYDNEPGFRRIVDGIRARLRGCAADANPPLGRQQ